MTDTTPPFEAQRFGRSQTPESPRPVHLPEPQNIPVLMNQMDPVFNDTNTYNIPHNSTFSPLSDSNHGVPDVSAEEHDPVQSFLNSAEAESARPLNPTSFALNADLSNANPGDFNGSADEIIPTDHNDATQAFAECSQTLTSEQPQSNGIEGADNACAQPAAAQSETTGASATDHATTAAVSPEATDGDRGGVDYQSLLDTIAQSTSTAPAAETITAPTTVPSHSDHPASSLLPVPGLPPKPPTQNNFEESTHFGAAETFQAQQSLATVGQDSTQGQDHVFAEPSDIQEVSLQQQVKVATSSENDLSAAIFDHFSSNGNDYNPQMHSLAAEATSQPVTSGVYEERPWTPNTQRVYDQFLEDERHYVTEGIWDKFPTGSRLFVGNLPSEKVTKRDLFHIFHRHGRLAQISIKQAYGFVQFHESASCYSALAAEQGVEVRGRKIHLEVSKPQKNTRGTKTARRRSRSPDRLRNSNDRHNRPSFSEFRDDAQRRREDQRRSPTPPRYRSRDDYRPQPQVPDPRGFLPNDNRMRSPYATIPPPLPPQFDEDAALQLPRRNPRDVPDVTILILDQNVGQGFINHVEDGFRFKGLRPATIWLNQRLPLQAVIKRQILEGVHAIVKLIQVNQYNGKLPLQVFDRSAGASNVNFNEYVDLDVSVAADIVAHTKQRAQGPVQQSPQAQFPPNPPFQMPHHYAQPPPPQLPHQSYQPPQSQYQHPRPPPMQSPYGYQQPQQHSQPQTPVSANSQSSNLQQLLANLRQPQDGQPSPQTPQSAQGGVRQPDLGGLLSNIAAHQQNQQHQQQHQQHQQQQQPHPQQPAYNQNFGQPPQQHYSQQTPGPAYGQGQQPNVQNIMEQLARYQR